MSVAPLDQHYFRHEYGRLVAMLVRRVGRHHLEAVEDAVQSALLAALETWTTGGVPESPSAWLFRVASNHVVGELRGRARRDRLIEGHGAVEDGADEPRDPLLAGDVRDDLLRMLFACCDESIPVESQLVMALKTLSGFSVEEIAERLFTTEANVYKRLTRARTRLREVRFAPTDLTAEHVSGRLPAVQSILYTMFTEGHLSSHEEHAIRLELCSRGQAVDGPTRGASGERDAGDLRPPRLDASARGTHVRATRWSRRLALLEEQDRSLWDPREIELGLTWLARSADGELFSRYHAEAGIAAEHCLARSFAETRWERIAGSYALLERVAPSALHRLNRALAVAEWKGPAAGLAVLEGLQPPSWLAGSYLWAAVFADLHRRCCRHESARAYREAALEGAPSAAIREALRRRLEEEGAASGRKDEEPEHDA